MEHDGRAVVQAEKAVHWAAACISGGTANQAPPPPAAASAIDSAVAPSAPAIAET